MTNEQRLERIEEHQLDNRERLVRLETLTEEIHSCIKPKDGKPSLPVRLDRVERFNKGVARTLWAAALAAIAATVTAVVAAFKGAG